MVTKKTNLRGSLLLLLAAFIWGSAFVAQSIGMEYIGPFTYNMSRSFIGTAVLLPVIYILGRLKKKPGKSFKKIMVPDRVTVTGGLACGVILAVASNFQQIGISMTTAGKSGFITALYIILVPIIGLFLGKKTTKLIWFCVFLALTGFYLLCVKEGFSVAKGDLLVLCCAVFFSFHILTIDYFMAKGADGVKMSAIQFLVTGVLSLIAALIFEDISFGAIWEAKNTILYAGVLSSGVAYTLQIVAQKDTEPTVATLVMSLESVFAAISGYLVLNEVLTLREFVGCALVFIAVILVEIPGFDLKKMTEKIFNLKGNNNA